MNAAQDNITHRNGKAELIRVVNEETCNQNEKHTVTNTISLQRSLEIWVQHVADAFSIPRIKSTIPQS
jgi:hypothetical protein